MRRLRTVLLASIRRAALLIVLIITGLWRTAAGRADAFLEGLVEASTAVAPPPPGMPVLTHAVRGVVALRARVLALAGAGRRFTRPHATLAQRLDDGLERRLPAVPR